jgi:prophage antirepressor-like protein
MSKRAKKRVQTREVTKKRQNIITLYNTKEESEENTETDSQWQEIIKDIDAPKAIIQRLVSEDVEVTQENNLISKTLTVENADILVIKDDNEDYWYKGKDICDILEYKNSRDAIKKHVGSNYKKSLADIGVSIRDTLKIDPQTTFINGCGFWQLVSRSRKEEAKLLWEKITKEILPELFATGTYTMPITKSDKNKLTKSFYDDNMISDFMENPCIYIAYVGKHKIIVNGFTKIVDVIKYGNTCEISRRDLKEHRKFYETFNVLGIWKSLAAKEVEKKIEKNFESLNMLVDLKIKGSNRTHKENRREHIVLTEIHNLDYCLNMIQQVVNKTILPQENKYLDRIKELEHENKLLRTKNQYLVKLYRNIKNNNNQLKDNIEQLKDNINDLRNN